MFGWWLLWSEVELVTPVGTPVGDLVAEDRVAAKGGGVLDGEGASVGLRQIEELPAVPNIVSSRLGSTPWPQR